MSGLFGSGLKACCKTYKSVNSCTRTAASLSSDMIFRRGRERELPAVTGAQEYACEGAPGAMVEPTYLIFVEVRHGRHNLAGIDAKGNV